MQLQNSSADEELSQHFTRYFVMQRATETNMQSRIYQLRYQVFCSELGYAMPHNEEHESDIYDHCSEHVLLSHISSGTDAGCVRLIYPNLDDQGPRLPFEQYATHAFDHTKLDLRNLEPEKCCELSRLAVGANFRRRLGEYTNAAGVAPLTQQDTGDDTQQPLSMRNFPFIAFSLCQATVAIILNSNCEHMFLGIEPRLQRHLSMHGIHLRQVSRVFDYYGARALYYTDRASLHEDIEKWSPALQSLYYAIASAVSHH
jgi:N-acyl amino acid synthase of PEP-CTERM/exosortase system